MGEYRKEDAALLAMQFWLLLLSFVAVRVFTDGPHELLMHVIADTVFFHSSDVRGLVSYLCFFADQTMNGPSR